MHELSICRSVADIVARHAGGRRVSVVRLRVGALRQVVPDTLIACWEWAWASHPDGAVLAGSVLEVDHVPARVSCRACGAHGVLVRPFVACATCGADAGHLDLTCGEEFLVTSFELAPTDLASTDLASGEHVPSAPTPSEPAPNAPAEV
ncbi:hydrogenase maturation nickel metallochaperone HypA [Frankia sp. AgPm24]|uniref:hydrogenase maturation nickel metallochaperone HypA n=1 Tax=Frankia sp. AgPm24 TaxID=631128 RepID=UPI00200C2889|nr:hydrogenase maturation nickel metallochaperone HypA [Frankia sp. AgPm24]MCK9921782.1 hydrogenase maturation nickel metallochaperone HypA [Frankia sp. AgPm24]